MREFKLILLLIICPVFLFGQEYLPMLNENSVWSVSDEKYAIIGDTVIGENVYQKIYFHKSLEDYGHEELTYLCAIREDVEEGKVWMIWRGNEEEYPLYDFSLEVGDSFEVIIIYYSERQNPLYTGEHGSSLVVSSMFYEEIDGVTRKVLKIHSSNFPSVDDYWIEGIGSTRGLIYAGIASIGMADYPYPLLLCLHIDAELIYEYNPSFLGCYMYQDEDHGCFDYASGYNNIDNELFTNSIIKVYPTIINNRINIQSEISLKYIEIYDSMGKQIYKKSSAMPFMQKTINTSGWKSGIYFLRVAVSTELISFKLIKY